MSEDDTFFAGSVFLIQTTRTFWRNSKGSVPFARIRSWPGIQGQGKLDLSLSIIIMGMVPLEDFSVIDATRV
jgi:hypothetical protein